MREAASFGERAVIARAIVDSGVPDPALNLYPEAVNALAYGTPRADAQGEGLVGKFARAIEEKILPTPTEAAAFLNLKPVTLSRYSAAGELPGMARLVLVRGGKRSFRTVDGIDVWPTDRLQQASPRAPCGPNFPHSTLGSMQAMSEYDPPPGTCVIWL